MMSKKYCTPDGDNAKALKSRFRQCSSDIYALTSGIRSHVGQAITEAARKVPSRSRGAEGKRADPDQPETAAAAVRRSGREVAASLERDRQFSRSCQTVVNSRTTRSSRFAKCRSK